MLTQNTASTTCFSGKQYAIPRGTIHSTAKAGGLSLPLDLISVRKCNRKLFKGGRSHIKNTAERIIKGFQRFDKVLWNETECFIFGRRASGYFDLRKLDGTKVHASAKAKELKLLEAANTILVELKTIANCCHNWQILQGI